MKKILIYSFSILAFFACKKSDLEPTLEQIKDVKTINTVEDLENILKGALDWMTSSSYYGRNFIINDEIRGDNVFANGSSGRFQTEGSYKYLPSDNLGCWLSSYGVIANANVIINADETALGEDSAKLKYIKGQALILRAVAHFDLLRNYGQQFVGGSLGIPYIKDSKKDLYPARNSVEEVKTNIYQDLNDAFNMMDDKLDSSSNKEYPSKYTAKALESRVALYLGEWSIAAIAAKVVIDSGKYTIIPTDNYVSSFAEDSAKNSIFELAFSDVDRRGINSLGFIYKEDGYGDIEVLPTVESLYEENDIRKKILGPEGKKLRNLRKYPALNGDDNVPIIRIEEVVLNYAEALFEQGQVGEAISQLNEITSKRNATAYSGTITKDDILNERRKELIFEGFRFFDLTRSGKGIPVVHKLQNINDPIPAGDHRLALPIPRSETDANSNIVQNEGYN